MRCSSRDSPLIPPRDWLPAWQKRPPLPEQLALRQRCRQDADGVRATHGRERTSSTSRLLAAKARGGKSCAFFCLPQYEHTCAFLCPLTTWYLLYTQNGHEAYIVASCLGDRYSDPSRSSC